MRKYVSCSLSSEEGAALEAAAAKAGKSLYVFISEAIREKIEREK